MLPRSYKNLGTAVNVNLGATVVTQWGVSSVAYPDAVGQRLLVAPIRLLESASLIRGEMPGLYAPLNNVGLAQHKTVVPMPDLGKELMLLCGYNGGGIAVDITGPWR